MLYAAITIVRCQRRAVTRRDAQHVVSLFLNEPARYIRPMSVTDALRERLADALSRAADVERELADSDAPRDPKRLTELAREHHRLAAVVDVNRRLEARSTSSRAHRSSRRSTMRSSRWRRARRWSDSRPSVMR